MAAGRHNKNQDGVYAVRPSKTAAKRNGASVGRKHPWRPVHDGLLTLTICRHNCAAATLRVAGRQTPLHAQYVVSRLSDVRFYAMILAQPRPCWTWASVWRS